MTNSCDGEWCRISCRLGWSTSSRTVSGCSFSNGCRRASRTTPIPCTAATYTATSTSRQVRRRCPTRPSFGSLARSSCPLRRWVSWPTQTSWRARTGRCVRSNANVVDRRTNPERSWEPERVQLCVQGLLLRDAGYVCDEGFLAFDETRERVLVGFDDDLVRRTLDLLGDLRDVAGRLTRRRLSWTVQSAHGARWSGSASRTRQPHSPGVSRWPLRRVLPRDPASRPLYVSEQGTVVGRDGNRVEVRRKGELLCPVE